VEDLKLSIYEIEHIPPYIQHLTIHTRESPLLDSEMLIELQSPHISQGESLDIQLAVVSDEVGRGPFGLGQEASGASGKECLTARALWTVTTEAGQV
jgi:hypothetical protein